MAKQATGDGARQVAADARREGRRAIATNVIEIPITRIWRVRRRGEWIDATVEQSRDGWRVTFTRKGRILATWRFDTRDQARDSARTRLQELERAGWTEHW